MRSSIHFSVRYSRSFSQSTVQMFQIEIDEDRCLQFDELFFDHFFFLKNWDLISLISHATILKLNLVQHVTLMDDRVVGIYFGKQNQSFKPKLGNLGTEISFKKMDEKNSSNCRGRSSSISFQNIYTDLYNSIRSDSHQYLAAFKE